MSQPDNGARVGPGAIAVIAAAALTLGALSLFSGLPALAALIAFAVIAAVALYACKREPSRRDITAEGPGSEATAMTQAVAVIGEGLPDPAIAVDRGKAVIFANALALDAFPTIRPGQPISTGLRSPAVLEALVTVLETGQNARVELKEHVPVERHFEIHLAAIPEDMGNTQGSRGVHAVLMVIRDLTQQERVERMRADFVTNVSHELRTPLASVIGLIETLQGPAREDKKARAEFLELIRLQAGRMSRLINDLLSLSRIEMQAHVRPRDEVDLSQTIMHVIDVLRPVADDAGVTLSAEGFDEPVIVQGARDELIQVFQNLIENAIKYGESGKKVVVSRTAPEDQDTGGEAARTDATPSPIGAARTTFTWPPFM